MAQSQDLIKQLLEAENKAEEMIAQAKANRLTKLRQAKDKAEEEVSKFREEQEKKFQAETSAKNATDHTKDLAGVTKAAKEEVDAAYSSNQAATVSYVVQKVMDVPIGLSDTQKQALIMGVV